MNIGKKLGVGFGSIVLIIFVIFLTEKMYLGVVTNNAIQVDTKSLPYALLAGEMRAHAMQVQQFLTDVSATHNPDGFNDAEEAAVGFKTGLTKFIEMYENEKDAEALKKMAALETTFDSYYETGKRMADAYMKEGVEAGNQIMEEFDATAAVLSDRMGQFQDEQVQEAKSMMHRIVLTIEKTDQITAILGAAALLLSILIGVSLRRSIVKQLINLRDTAIEFSNGDLTRRFAETVKTPCVAMRNCEKKDCPSHTDNPDYQQGACWSVAGSNASITSCPRILKGKAGGGLDNCDECEVFQKGKVDEIGELARGLNGFVSNLQKMIKETQDNADHLTASSETLTSISSQMSAGAEQTSGKSNTVAASAEEMSSNMSSVATAVEQASANTNMIASSAEQMAATINEIAQNSEKARSITGGAVSQAKNSAERVGELGSAAQEISKVTETITEISEQTNLLALNATIEAARAGEAGKGFAVVANEIKELARQTADATGEIKKRIEGIQNSISGTITDIEQVPQVINDVNQIVSTIATAVEEQSVTTKEIAENVAQTSTGIGEVTENVTQSTTVAGEIAKDISEVNQAAGEMANSSAQVNMSAEELSRLSEQLKVMIGRFRV